MRAGCSVLAVIPARSGSKGIPDKNMCRVGGISLTGRAAGLAANVGWVDTVVVSTDSERIQREAVENGAEALFLRPEHLSGDTVGARETWKHAWLASEEAKGETYDISLYLEPTSPLRNAQDLERTFDALLASDAGVAATVSRSPAHYSPEKTLVVGQDHRIAHYLEDGAKYATRQNIRRSYFHRNGICYAARREAIAVDDDTGTILDDTSIAVEIERPVVNIDDPFDLELAEWLIQKT